MDCLLDFQESLLNYACTHSAYSKDELVAEFGQEIFDWIDQNGIRQRLLDPLKNHIQASELEKQQILESFRHDIEFYNSSDDPNYRFALTITDGCSETLVNIKKLLIGFYEQLKNSGFHPLICGHDSEGFTDRRWWSGYKNANPGRHTCSVCDASLSAAGQTIEHFFPKNQCPALSTHPFNLLPLCKTCNNDVKKNKDPLANNSIATNYLPYHRYVQPETKLIFADDGQGGYVVNLAPLTDDPEIKQRVNSNFTSWAFGIGIWFLLFRNTLSYTTKDLFMPRCTRIFLAHPATPPHTSKPASARPW